MLELASKTPNEWIDCALAHLDAVLIDHAHCERKAAATAMGLVTMYPQETVLVKRMVKLAQEELRHFAQVHRIILERGLTLTKDLGDPYAQKLLKLMRDGRLDRLIDRLLVCGLIEARSCERLTLLGEHLPDAELRAFYRQLATAEAGHQRLFYDLARMLAPVASVDARADELASEEATLLAALPIEARIH